MKSLICKLDGSEAGVAAALQEAEVFANHCNLPKKETLHLRLLAEELLGMAGGILEIREGKFWIEQEGEDYRLCLRAHAPVGEEAEARLLSASTSGENTFYQGVSGKIRLALDWFARGAAAEGYVPLAFQDGFLSAQSTEWSLELYRQSAAREKKAQAWDELEKSVLSRLADDIRVGLRTDEIEITIYKKIC